MFLLPSLMWLKYICGSCYISVGQHCLWAHFLKWNLFLSDYENIFSVENRGNIEMHKKDN